MRAAGATLALAAVIAAVAPSSAPGAATIDLRIEGRTQTLFEGPVQTSGHDIQASSDGTRRPCDATNGGSHPTPGPTPTAAGVDAMLLAGQTFDGQWYPGYGDYLITRWGPDRQSAAENEYWGLLVNQAFTSKGGCQYLLSEGDRVLWAYNAFANQPFLTLSTAGDSSDPPLATATATLGQPFTAKVSAYSSGEGSHHDLGAYQGASVSPVSTAANGFQTVEGANPSTVTTGPGGSASVTFTTLGWHRLKGSASGTFRSNRLDVCVSPEGAGDCGGLPPDDRVRSVQPSPPPEAPVPGTTPTREPAPAPPSGTLTPTEPGGSTPSGFSSGTLPGELRVGGLVLRPLDDRAPALHYAGRWRPLSDTGAWRQTVTLGRAGATLTVHLAAGRAVFVLRDVRRPARVEITAAPRHRTVSVAASRSRASRLLIGPRRTRAGTVRLRILDGTVGLDGVALAP